MRICTPYHKILRLWYEGYQASPFGSAVLLTTGVNILLTMIGIITGILVARLLGPQGRGELSAIQNIPGFIANVAMLGLPEAIVYFSARKPDYAGHYLSSAIALALSFSPIFMIGGYFAMPFLLSAQSDKVITAARYYLLCLVPLSTFLVLPLYVLQGRNDFIAWNRLRLLPTLGWLVVIIIALVLNCASSVIVAAGYLVILALLFFPTVYVVFRRVSGPFLPNKHIVLQMLQYGFPSMISKLPGILNIYFGQMVIAAFLPAQDLGFYAVAMTWGNFPSFFFIALGTSIFPRVASLNNRSQQINTFVQGIRLAFLLAIGFAISFIILTPWVFHWVFGNKFTPAVPLALIMIVIGAIGGLSLVIEEGLRGLGYPASIIWAKVGGLIVTAVVLFVLLRSLGVLGVVLAQLLAHSVVAAGLIVRSCQVTEHSPKALLYPTRQEFKTIWRFTRVLHKLVSEIK
jgi:O-antigen/teichoic acid export membrane protein